MAQRSRGSNRATDRARAQHLFIETRTGAYYGRLGYLAGLGRSSEAIAAEMGDGIHPSYVRTLLRRWGFPQPYASCRVPLTFLQRQWLEYRAEKAGTSPEEWLSSQVVDHVVKGPENDN